MAKKRKLSRKRTGSGRQPAAGGDSKRTTLRIIGGYLRGRRLTYSGDRRTRPMKDRVREAAFDLIGPSIRGMHTIDLFAGTGAIGLEAISRGAAKATLVERHFPTARLIQKNVEALSLEHVADVVCADVFHWVEHLPDLGQMPWAVFCSPPYRFYEERGEEMLRLIERLTIRAPQSSVLVVEGDCRLNVGSLPVAASWDVRQYPPTVLAIRWFSSGSAASNNFEDKGE